MQLISDSILVPATMGEAWNKLVDWRKWPTWDGGMESISLQDPLQVGTVGRLKLKNGPAVNLKITEFIEGKSYTSEFALLGTRYIFGHYLEILSDGGTVGVKFTADADGITAPFFSGIMKSTLKKELPGWMQAFKDQLNATTSSNS